MTTVLEDNVHVFRGTPSKTLRPTHAPKSLFKDIKYLRTVENFPKEFGRLLSYDSLIVVE